MGKCFVELIWSYVGRGDKSYAHERMINTSYGQEWVSQTAIVLDNTDHQFPSTVISAEDKMKE